MSESPWFETAIALTLQATIVVVASEVVSRTLRTAPGRDRLWTGCLYGLAALPMAAMFLPHLRIVPATIATDASLAGSFPSPSSLFWRVLATLWLLGATLQTVRLIVDVFRMHRMLRTALRLPETVQHALASALPECHESTDEVSWDVAGRRVRLRVSRAVRSPCCWQLQTPIILLPEALLDFPAEELAMVIRHELAHLRSGHPLALFIQRLATIAFWCHPAFWWASRQAARAREFVCDEAAVSSRSAAAPYLRMLLRMLLTDGSQVPNGALGFGTQRGLLAQRAEHLVSKAWHESRRPERRGAVWLGLVFAVVAMLAVWIPIHAGSRRALWSPWPAASAQALRAIGLPARDYEIDGHRLRGQEQTRGVRRTDRRDSL